MNVIILGDPHIGKGVSIGRNSIGTHLNSRITDQVNLLDWTLDQAIDCLADHIIITGDIFEDPKPSHPLITLFISWLKKCQMHNIYVHLIAGNHDLLRSGNNYISPLDVISESEFDHVSVYKYIDTVTIGLSAFTFVPFRDRKSLGCETNLEAINKLRESFIYEMVGIPNHYKKIMVGHLALAGAIPVGNEIDDMRNELYCPLDMFKDYDYVWMGHVHKPQVLSRKPYIAHIGSMDISDFLEAQHKKHIVIIDSNSFYIKYLPTRTLKKMDIVIPPDTLNPTDYVLNILQADGANLDNSIVRLEIAMSSLNSKSIDKLSVEKYLLSKGVFNIAGIFESKKVAIVKKNNNALNTKMDVPSAIKIWTDTYVDEDKRQDFMSLATEIVDAYQLED